MSPASANQCRIVAAEKLPSAIGKSLICDEIARAMAQNAPKARYTVEVKVLSASRLFATMTVNGRILPEQNFATSDRELGAEPIRRFAEALASEVAKAAKE